MPADVAGNAAAGDAPHPRGDFLDRDHQRKCQQHGPADAVAELRTGLAVGADPRRIVVGRPGDQSGSERFQERLMGLDFQRRFLPTGLRAVVAFGLLAICHARFQPPRQRSGQDSVPDRDVARSQPRQQASEALTIRSRSFPQHPV
jgi:hypothetical protein